jgi:hypothetical protein
MGIPYEILIAQYKQFKKALPRFSQPAQTVETKKNYQPTKSILLAAIMTDEFKNIIPKNFSDLVESMA